MPDPINLAADLPIYLTAMLVGYLLGSIPFGLILTKFAGLGDIRKIGSGNIGATNVLRTGKPTLAAFTLALDAVKGALAVLLGKTLGPDIAVLAATGAILGHTFPVWLGFAGGKGVATAIGIMVALFWPVGLLVIGTWILTAVTTRYSSLSSLLSIGLAPVYFWLAAQYQMAEVSLLIAALVFLRHKDNIARLISGTESRLGRSKTS